MKKLLAIMPALIMALAMVPALAAEWDIDKGDITVNAGSGAQTVTQGDGAAVEDSAPVITGSSTENTLTINADNDKTAKVTLSGVNIDVSNSGKAAVSTDGGGDVIIELDGENTLKSGSRHAGLEKKNGGRLTIAGESENGKLTATGGNNGAGIGGGLKGSGSGITISGGEVNATGGSSGAGIGGGVMGSGSGITIYGGEVNATGGSSGAGIGGGLKGSGSDITISGGEVTATGGIGSAGIGGGYCGHGNNIAISGGEVNATGGKFGAGIGGGTEGSGSGITISDGEVNATGGSRSAGIGGGNRGHGNNIAISGGTVKATSDYAGAGIGGGWNGKSGKVTFSGKVNATVQGGVGYGNYGAGAGIGDGGSSSNGNPVDGDDLHRTNSDLLNVSGLEPGAIIRCYKQGTVIPDSLLYEIPELPDGAELTSFVKSRVIAIPDNMSTLLPEGVTFNTASPVTFDANHTTANLLYSFTVTGTPGAEVTITDSGAKFYNNNGNWVENSITVKLPTESIADYVTHTVYGYRPFTKDDIDDGVLKNTAKAGVVGSAELVPGEETVRAEDKTGPEPSENPNPSPSTEPSPTPTPTPGGGNGGGGHSHYYPTTTPVPVIVIPPKTGDMTIWQSILHFLGIR